MPRGRYNRASTGIGKPPGAIRVPGQAMQTELTYPGAVRRSAARFCQLIAWTVLAVSGSGVASGIELENLYTVEVPFDARDDDARDNAYRAAVRQVMVRITGSGAAAQSAELLALFPDPARYVLQFRPGPDDTLVVSLDGPAIERELRAYGATIWSSDRPLTLVWLAVDRGRGDREVIAAVADDNRSNLRRRFDRNRMLRDRVADAAAFRGVPIRLPRMDAADLEILSFTDVWGGFEDRLGQASARYGADSYLVGRIRSDNSQPPRWTWYFGEQRRDFTGEPEEAINMLADALAAEFSFSGAAPTDSYRLTITGINTVDAYGRVQSYMENLQVLDSVIVEAADGDSITYRVQVQGGLERLESALGRSRIFSPAGSDYAIDTRRFDLGDNRSYPARIPAVASDLEYRYVPQS